MKDWARGPEELPIFGIVDGQKVAEDFECAMGVAMDVNGDLLVVDYDDNSLYRVDLRSQIRTRIMVAPDHNHTGVLNYPGSSPSKFSVFPFR